MHFLEGGKIQISLKLDLCGANEVDIWNQRPRLRRNRLILVDKAGGILLTSCQFRNTYSFTSLQFTPQYHMLISLIEFCREMLLSDL